MFDTTLTMSPRSARVCPAQHRPVVSQLSGRHAARDIGGRHSQAALCSPGSQLSLTQEYTSNASSEQSGPSACRAGAGPTEDGPAPASPNIRNNRPGLGRGGGREGRLSLCRRGGQGRRRQRTESKVSNTRGDMRQGQPQATSRGHSLQPP